MLKKTVYSILVLIFFILVTSCADSSKETYALEINFEFEDNKNCKTFGGEEFTVSLYSNSGKKTYSEKFKCEKDLSSVEIAVLEKADYTVEVILKDPIGQINRFGSAKIEFIGSDTLQVLMKKYIGGLYFYWEPSICSSYNVEDFKFSVKNELGESVLAEHWGVETVLDGFPFKCTNGEFQLFNLPEGSYLVTVKGYKKDSEIFRVVFTSGEREVSTGQTMVIEIDKVNLVVSDLFVTWGFDSRSISESSDPCVDAGVSQIRIEIEGDDYHNERVADCTATGRTFEFYDIHEGNYTVSVSDAEGRFFGEKEYYIEPGKIGKDTYKKTILIKEK